MDIDGAMQIIRLAQEGQSNVNVSALSDAIETVVRETGEAYTQQSASYEEVREAQPWHWDSYIEGLLLALVRSRITDVRLASPSQRWRLLDVGAGYGRDVIRLAKQPDIEPFALEYSDGFVKVLQALQRDGILRNDAVIKGDMRDMPAIADASFQCVRNHATLHHLPVVHDDLGADAAVAEARRVLVLGGVFYVMVKEGVGVDLIDTGEGLGGRFYQLFTRKLLYDLLQRHSFSVVHLEEGIEMRPSGEIPWLFALAVAS